MEEQMTMMSHISEETNQMNRRNFLKISGILGMGLGAAAVLPPGAEAVKFNQKLYKVTKTRLAMGTFVSMTLLHGSKDQAQQALGEAFEEIDRLTREMSRFDNATAIAQLNKQGAVKDVSPEVVAVMNRALQYHKVSNGAFDISVQPVVDLFKDNFSSGKRTPPAKFRIERALKLVNSSDIRVDGRNIQFRKDGMGITLDGIAKGYIVDRASEILVSHNISNHLINAGGDIRTMGHKKDGKPWSVAIQDPQKKKAYPDIIHLTSGAIATSGNYEVYFDREKMFHHIVNPATGFSPDASASVSVLAHTAMDADALSTTVFVMEPTRGIQFINSLSGTECLIVDKGTKKVTSSGWKSAM
jgi:thiamine biosynthesis lipoprotein